MARRLSALEYVPMMDDEANRAMTKPENHNELAKPELIDYLVKRLTEEERKEHSVEKLAKILHDKDKLVKDSDDGKHKKGDKKYNHWHIPVLFNGDRSGKTPKQFAELLNSYIADYKANIDPTCETIVKPNRIEMPTNKSKSMSILGKYANMVLYCLHENKAGAGRPDGAVNRKNHKWDGLTWLYEESELTLIGTDLETEREIAKEANEKEALIKNAQHLIEGILSGKVREYELFEKEEYAQIYVEKMDKINTALNWYNNHFSMKTHDKQVIFVEGEAGAGKTTYVKKWAEAHKLHYYVANSGEHMFDDYQGQEVLILDDMRDSDIKPNDLLKILDNNTNRKVQARYHDRVLRADYIFITSTKPLKDWYKGKFAEDVDGRKQLFRRIKTVIEVKKDYIILNTYNRTKNVYEPTEAYSNEITAEFQEDNISDNWKAFSNSKAFQMGMKCPTGYLHYLKGLVSNQKEREQIKKEFKLWREHAKAEFRKKIKKAVDKAVKAVADKCPVKAVSVAMPCEQLEIPGVEEVQTHRGSDGKLYGKQNMPEWFNEFIEIIPDEVTATETC